MCVKVTQSKMLVTSSSSSQWRYVGGNNWGVCADGTGKVAF